MLQQKRWANYGTEPTPRIVYNEVGLSIYIGETRIFFLDSSANGHVMAYPIGKSDEEILQEFRALVAKDKADSVGLKTM